MFSLRTLMVVVLVAALFAAALATRSYLWLSICAGVTVVLLLAAIAKFLFLWARQDRANSQRILVPSFASRTRTPHSVFIPAAIAVFFGSGPRCANPEHLLRMAAWMLWPVLFLGVAEGEPEWKAGIATVKITPEEPLQMAGYASRTKPFEKVNDDLYAKALALEDAGGNRAVIIATDLIGFKASLAESICRQISEKTGLAREQILLNSIHTHSAPTLSLDSDAREGFSAEDAKKTAAYTRTLEGKIVEVAVRAVSSLEPARLWAGSGVATFVMNRREFTPGGVILGVNPRGFADRSVPVLRIDGPDGKLRAVLFLCACHNTTLGDKNMLLSGDYGGYAQRAIEKQHPGATALMLLGCAGDANPHPRGTMEMARDHGESLGKEVCRVLGEKLKPIRGPLSTAFEQVDLPLADAPPREELEKMAKSGPGYKQGVAREMLALLDKGEKVPTHYRAPIAVFQFGDDLTLVALSGEIVADYVILLERALGPLDLWVAAYSNDVFGYLPSRRVIEEGGYETRGIYSGGPGFFSPAAQETLVNAVRELAKKAGRKGT